MFTARAPWIFIMACCLVFSACSDDSRDSAPVYVPTAFTAGTIPTEEVQGLTGDSEMPELLSLNAEVTLDLSEIDTGIMVNAAYDLSLEESSAEPDFFSELSFRYDDNGWLSSYVIGDLDTVYDSIGFAYRFTGGHPEHKAVFRDIDDTAYIRYLFVSEPEDHESYEVSLIRMHRFYPEDELTDPDHDVSDETFQLACREYRDNGGRLVRQVFYDPMDPENILDTDVTRIHLYRYDELGRLSGSTMFYFSGEFDGDFSDLDRDHEACRQEYRVFYDSLGNLRYWIITLVSSMDEDESTLVAFTWEEAPGVRGQAADFLRNRVRWIDTHPCDDTGNLGLVHVLFPVDKK